MSLSNLVRRANKGIAIGLVSTAMYAGSLGLNQSVYSQQTQTTNNAQNDQEKVSNLPFPLPEKLTQQENDFYKDPHKEFEVYRKIYVAFAQDGIINSEEIETLETILAKTLQEIDYKTRDGRDEFKDSFPFNEKTLKYMKFVKNVKDKDLIELRKHLELTDNWKNSKAVKGDFWNYGTGFVFYGTQDNDGNTGTSTEVMWCGDNKYCSGLPNIFKEDFYEHITSKSLLEGKFNYGKVLRPEEEFPAQTKFNYWLGLLGGFVIPQLLGASSLIRKHKRGKKTGGEDVGKSIAGRFFLNSLPGYLVFDSIHPIVYPTRLAIPIVYEGMQWLFGKRDYSSSTTNNDIETRKEQLAKEKAKTKVPELPTDFIDPWSIDLRGKQGGN